MGESADRARGLRFETRVPEPANGWVRWSPASWPGTARIWWDVGARKLGDTPNVDVVLDVGGGLTLEDTVYLPPVSEAAEVSRRQLAADLVGRGLPVLWHDFPGGAQSPPGVVLIVDLLAALLDRDLSCLQRVPEGATALWPLIAGYTDQHELWHEGLERLREARVSTVVGVTGELRPEDRRRIVEASVIDGFEALFHRQAPSERAFARAVNEFGLFPWLDRPLPVGSPPLRENRRLAGVLVSIGDLWLRMDKGEGRAQAYFRAARWIEREKMDIRALTREGNLDIVGWLDSESREVLRDWVTTGHSTLLERLRVEYLAASSPDATTKSSRV